MSEIINNNDSYIVRTNGRIYVKLGGRYIALIDEDGNLNVKLKTSISTVSNFNDINSEGLYYYNGNIYAYANGSPYLLTGGGGSGDVINQVLSGDLRAVTSNAVYVTTENIKNNLANKVLPFEEFKTISSVVYNPTDITEGRVLYSLNLKCFILENTVGGRTTYYTNWKGSEKYQTIDSENVSQITLKPDVLYLFTNLSVGQASVRTLYMAKSSGDLTRILTDRDLNDVLTLDDVDTEITSSSSKPVASSAIYTALSKLGSIEYFDGTLSAEETINIIDSATTANDILVLYSYKYKTFVAKYNNNYYKRWNTADKFFDGTTPNKHILFVCDDTLYFWNNDLVTVNVDNIDDCIIYVDLYMRGGLLPTPSASDLGKYAIVESNTYQLYRAEQFNNVISYTAKSFSKNRLYINDNKLYLWNGSELVQVGISEFNLLIAPFDGVINSATVQESSYTGTGDIFYITSLQRFAFRVISLNQTKYYDNWSDSGLYFGENRKPRKDTIYVNNGVGYVFDGTNGLIAIGGSAAIHLASNPKSTVNSVGAIHVTDSTLPSNVSQNTKYIIYKDITTGNVDGLNYIQLAPGTKIVPNGGILKVPVVGGEMSWVHSSDIGMIQDGELPTNMTRAEVGAHNADVLRMIAASQWNLILDGTYYVNVGRAAGTIDVVSGDGGRRNARLNAVIVSRPLRIRGGGLIAERYLFCVEPGGGLVMEDVMLDNLSNYQMIYVDADGDLVDSVELYRCSLKTSASPTGTDKYAKNGRFIGGKARNAGNVDTVNDLMPNGLSRQFNTTNCKTILGMSDNGGGLGSRFGQKSATADVPSQLLVYPLGQAFPGDSNSSRAAAECAYDMWSQLYVPQAGGGYVFKERSGSTTKHFGMYGDFVPTPDDLTGVYKENGEVVYYEPMYVHDTYENGALVRGANPEVEHNGLRRLIIEDCTVMCQLTAIELGGMEVTDEFRIHGCHFYNILALAVNFGTSNDQEAADDWASRSCPLEVSGNTFKGPGELCVPSSSTTYACALLYEGDKVVFADNVIEDIVTTTTTYDCYLSCNNLEYRGNVIRNVLNWQTGKKLYGYMKAKKEKINAVYRARWRDTPAAHPMKMSRVYEGNRYEVNLKDVRRLCDGYMETNRASLLPDYQDTAWDEVPQEAKDGVLRQYVLKTMFDNIVSTWAFDSYVIRDNVFDWPDCRVDGASLSGGQARVRRWVFSGNVLKGLSFCNTQADGYDKYLFAIQCLDEGTDVEIVGNRFESKGHEVINLLCANDQKALASLRVEDNTFVECGYRITQKGRLQGGTYYDGVLVAGKVHIRGNEEAVGLDRGFTGPYYYDVTQYFAQKGLPVMYCGLGGEDDITEVWDSQAAGVAAQTGKMVLLPIGKGRFALHSRHLCRPMQKDGDGIPVLDGDCSLSLINSFMLRSSSGGGIAPDSKGYAINISYCVRGRWRERKMELRCVPYESVYRGVSVRGVDGVRWMHSRTYPGSGNPSYNKVYYTDLAPVEDLGLHFLLIHRSVVASNKSYANNGAPMIRLALYTDSGGTLNDPGTVITIRVSDIAANVDMPASGNGVTYGATSLFETFLPKGSALTSAERTALKTADYCLYKGEPDESQGRRSSTLLAADAGWWCVDPDSGLKVIWNGTEWETDKKIVSLTLAAYDALTTKDENTLYLIVDA